MRKKVASFVLMACIILSLLPVTVGAINYAPGGIISADSFQIGDILSAVSKQSFSKLSSTEATGYIEHFINNTSGYVRVPNNSNGEYSGTATDGSYTLTVHPSMGCFHYAEFIATKMHGSGNQRLYIDETKGSVTASGLKIFLQKNAQAGEHLVIPQAPHSLSFVSCAEDGFYVLQYYGKTEAPFLSYSTYSDFASLLNGLKAEFYIYNLDTAVNSYNSNSIPTQVSIPDSPIGCVISKSSSNTARLSWYSVPGAASYEVQYYRRANSKWTEDSDYTNKTSTSYITTGLSNYDSYQFQIRAVNSAGKSDWTKITYNKGSVDQPEEKTGTVTIQYNANGGSGAPASHSATKDGNGVVRFNLSSTKPTRSGYTFLGWRLENSSAYGVDSPGQSIALGTGNATSNEKFTYYAQWEANDPPPTTTPTAPPAPVDFSISYLTDNTATVSWNASSGASSYQVEFWSRSFNAWRADDMYKGYLGTQTTSYVTNGLSNHSSYQFRVRAINSAGQSAWTEFTYIKPTTEAPAPPVVDQPSVPYAPSNFKLTWQSDNTATVSWNASSGASSYQVEFWSRSFNAWRADDMYKGYLGTQTTSYVTNGLRNHSSYEFRVRAINAQGSSDWAYFTYYK